MKKYIIASSILAACFFKSNAQSFQLIDTTGVGMSSTNIAQSSYTFWVDTSAAYSFMFNVKNTTSSAISIKVKKYVISNPLVDGITFCIGVNCYPPTTTLSAATGVAANSTLPNGFLTDFTAVSTPNTARVLYTVFNAAIPGDSISVTINYNVTEAIGINQLGVMNDELRIYPNPASTSINLTINQFDNETMNSIVITDMLGKCVHRQITTSSNSLIDISDLPDGIYMYSVLVGGKVIKTSRVIVSR